MTKYEQHPLGICYPHLTTEELQKLKGQLQGPGPHSAVILFEGKILDGWHGYNVAKEIGLELEFETPEITDPITYVINRNEGRRHLSIAQRADIADDLADLKRGRPLNASNEAFKSGEKTRTQLKVAKSTFERVRRAKKTAGPELKAAIKQGTINTGQAEKIAKAPHDKQPELLQAVQTKSKANAAKVPSDQPKGMTSEEAAKDAACLEVISAPSTFPPEALIPQDDHPDTAGLRLAIQWLRDNEGKLKDFTHGQVDEMQVMTNRIKSYEHNYGNFPRPDGPIDPRILAWQADLWRRQQRQHDRLRIRAAVRARNKPAKGAEPKATQSFSDRFISWWMIVEDSTARLFKPREHTKLVRRFKEELQKLSLGDVSSEEMDAVATAAAQKSTGNSDS